MFDIEDSKRDSMFDVRRSMFDVVRKKAETEFVEINMKKDSQAFSSFLNFELRTSNFEQKNGGFK